MNILANILLFLLVSIPVLPATFSADRIEEACRNYIHTRANGHYKVSFDFQFEEMNFKSDNVKAIFDEKLINQNIIIMNFLQGEVTVKSLRIPFDLYKQIYVYKAKEDLNANTKIELNHIYKEKYDINIEEIEKYKSPVDRVTFAYIKAGELLSSDNTQSGLKVKRGQKVTVIAASGAVSVRAIGTALQDGRVGDVIRLKRNGSKKTLQAKINDNGELILNE